MNLKKKKKKVKRKNVIAPQTDKIKIHKSSLGKERTMKLQENVSSRFCGLTVHQESFHLTQRRGNLINIDKFLPAKWCVNRSGRYSSWGKWIKRFRGTKKAQYLRPSFYSKAQHLEMWRKKSKNTTKQNKQQKHNKTKKKPKTWFSTEP